MPMLNACDTRPFAHARSCGSARFGIAACDAGRNGISQTVATSASAIRIHGRSAKASARNATAAARSDTIMITRRSYVSPSHPPIGASTPDAANVARNTADTHRAEPVCAYTSNVSATIAICEPVTEMARATLRR